MSNSISPNSNQCDKGANAPLLRQAAGSLNTPLSPISDIRDRFIQFGHALGSFSPSQCYFTSRRVELPLSRQGEPVTSTPSLPVGESHAIHEGVFQLALSRESGPSGHVTSTHNSSLRDWGVASVRSHRQVDYKTLSQIYQYDFLSLPPATDVEALSYFEMKRNLVAKIENILEHPQKNEREVLIIRKYIREILDHPAINHTLGELGMIYFYLDKSHETLPCLENFIKYRMHELKKGVDDIDLVKISGSPSRINPFLLQAMGDMVIDSKGKINEGGIMATLFLIQGELSQYFDEGHLLQMLAVLKHLFKNKTFRLQLEAPLGPLPSDMESLIRIDLKIPLGIAITPRLVKIACLIALLANLRQYEANCFVVGPFNYAIQCRPDLILKHYQALLQTGQLSLSGIQIPISCLVADHLRHNVLQQALQLSMNFFETNQSTAVYYSNSSSQSLIPRPVKINFIDFFQKVFFSLDSTCSDFLSHSLEQNFIYALLAEMNKYFWLQNCQGEIKIIDRRVEIIVSDRQLTIPNFGGDTNLLEEAIAEHRRLVYIAENKCVPIYSIEKFKLILIDMIDKIYLRMHPTAISPQPILQFVQFLKEFIFSNAMQDSILNFLCAVNQVGIPLSKEQYSALNLMIFHNDGGYALELPSPFLGLKLREKTFVNGTHANLMEYFKFLHSLPNKESYLSSKKLMLAHGPHAFLMHPYQFALIWKSEEPENILHTYCYKPMERLLSSHLSLKKIATVLYKTFKTEEIVNELMPLFSTCHTWKKFHDQFVQNRNFDRYHESFLVALDQEINKISCEEIPWNTLLSKIPNTLPSQDVSLIEEHLRHAFSSHIEASPLELAVGMQRILAKLGKFFPIALLEILICQELGRPVTWILGDLNYSTGVEFRHHDQLTYKIFPNLGFALCSRSETEDSLLSSHLMEIMQSFTIAYE